MSKTDKVIDTADKAMDQATRPLMGQAGDPDHAVGHPLHPATVHWPIAFLSTNLTIGAIPVSSIPSAIANSRWFPPFSAFPAIAHYAGIAGLAFSLPSIITGFGEEYQMIRNQIKSKGSLSTVVRDAWQQNDKDGVKLYMTSKHASLNTAVAGIVAWNVYHSLSSSQHLLPRYNMLASALAIPILFYCTSRRLM
ncbi:hypothetical protein DB88DRAFT_225757 [Papiliotrema laurentii]|uniref:DUF2231 domain-containing protein n=1 Tax=Papiliotrema laurentii TaxID=5418 RepID=A0AAD9L5Q4_PAPLA|nr:hypothetical protein DB88DRAFT_225757 [Papiliotrema laurentii]